MNHPSSAHTAHATTVQEVKDLTNPSIDILASLPHHQVPILLSHSYQEVPALMHGADNLLSSISCQTLTCLHRSLSKIGVYFCRRMIVE